MQNLGHTYTLKFQHVKKEKNGGRPYYREFLNASLGCHGDERYSVRNRVSGMAIVLYGKLNPNSLYV